ncbi:DCC1 [Candida metapsilosis]|uniref:DCC1 n=1 Tax=Candida metapsilosis TaxID=273372 RepID=A0A8H7ZCJ3_9ASCO|nr:DCC1 [Candida metapsilosis]
MSRTIPVYQQLRPDANYTYKLIQLPPSLLSHLATTTSNDDDSSLDLKTKPNPNSFIVEPNGNEDDGVVVCTRDSTFKLRQNNHSNCVLLMNQRRIKHEQESIDEKENGSVAAAAGDDGEVEALMGFSQCNYVYELTQVPGSILDIVPEYNNNYNNDTNTSQQPQIGKMYMTKSKLSELSPCSPIEFEKMYRDSCLCEIEETRGDNYDYGLHVYKLSLGIISQILYTLITFLISQSKQSSTFTVKDLHVEDNEKRASVFADWQVSMIEAVLYKFTSPVEKQDGNEINSATTPQSLRLNDDAVSHWFGIQELSKLDYSNNGTTTTVADFLLNWKTSLPSFYNVPLDIVQLQGNYYTTSSSTSFTSASTSSSSNSSLIIHFVDQSSLSRDVPTRFKQLLQIQPSWKYDEFVACLQPVLEHGKKVDSVILKYGKKKRVKRDQFVVCGR